MKSGKPAKEPVSTDMTPLARNLFLWRAIAALVSGLMLSCAFPPLNWSIMAWFALVPIMLVPTPRKKLERILIGLLFGYAHFATALHWLNEVGFCAGYLLAVVCALFPMAWYCIVGAFNWRLKDKRNATLPGAGYVFIADEWILIAHILIQAALWVAIEYLRSMIFTGFPWDMVGISQFRRLGVASLAQYTGVYGVSFMVLLANGIIAAELSRQARMFFVKARRQFPWHFALMTVALVPICILQARKELLPPEGTPSIRIAAVQGNIPQCREWTEEQFVQALRTYVRLSEKAAADYKDLDMLLWPESAIPAPIDYQPFMSILITLQQRIQKPLLLGALRVVGNPSDPENCTDFNSAVLLDEKS
ncbi:MAG: apolipoprotein N-acyltransferase, partial [Victivallales bacterium]|nr:apolipoprotein N-acyltransferase [Victivallales bacterium]